jgi:hypothetical protein
MAYGTNQGWKKIIYFSTFTKEDEYPHFQVRTKQEDNYVDLPDATFVEGYLHSLQFKDEPSYDKKTTEKNLYVKLFDGDELYIIRVKFFMIGRSIMNSLANLVTLDPPLDLKLTIRLYRTKPNERGDKYARAWVGYGVEALDWNMTAEQMKSLTRKVTVNGKEMTDSSALDKRLTELMEMAIKHVELHHITPDKQPATAMPHEDKTSGTKYSDPKELDEMPGQKDTDDAVNAFQQPDDGEEVPPADPEGDDLPF